MWLVAYPLLVPNTPRKILVTSLLAASMGPAGLFISAAATGAAIGRPIDVAAYFLTSNYLCAIIAYVIARIVYRVNVQLKNAREVGSYQLIEPIGAGGMGEVWRAQHRLLARPAAVKLIRSPMLGGSGRAREMLARRFEREARDTASLASIHTVAVYDFGVTEENDFYYVMELLRGPDPRTTGGAIWTRRTRAGSVLAAPSLSFTRERPMLVAWSTATSNPQTSWSVGSVQTVTS